MREKSLLLDKAIDIARSNKMTSKQLESMKSNTNDPPKKKSECSWKRERQEFQEAAERQVQTKKECVPEEEDYWKCEVQILWLTIVT